MKLKIQEIISSSEAFSSDLGVLVREMYRDVYDKEVIEFDFEGVRNVSPSFLSQSAMPILLRYSESEIGDHLQFISTPRSFDYCWAQVIRAIEAKKKLNTKE